MSPKKLMDYAACGLQAGNLTSIFKGMNTITTLDP